MPAAADTTIDPSGLNGPSVTGLPVLLVFHPLAPET
jgi:hypothetical protein